MPIDFFDHLANDATLPADCADDFDLALPTTVARIALALMLVGFFTADEGFVYFNDAHKLAEIRIFHSGSKPHAHIPSGLIGAASDKPVNLVSTNALFAGEHQMENPEPRAQRLLCLLKDCFRFKREAIRRAIILAALFALPVPRTRGALVNTFVVATRAAWTGGPTPQQQIIPTRLFIREQCVELGKGHLANECRLSG